MQFKEYQSYYQRRFSERRPDEGEIPDPPGMVEARKWSGSFGQLLHDSLNKKEIEDLGDFLTNYMQWVQTDLPQLSASVGNLNDRTHQEQAANLTFHILNQPMLNMWGPVLNGQWRQSGGARRHIIRQAQNALAINGASLYQRREVQSQAKGYFDEENKNYRDFSNGLLNEIDTGIVLLNIVAKHPSLTVIPGPVQFEHDQKAHNADFILIDVNAQEAIGVQTSSFITNEKYQRYNKDLLLFVDGSADLANVTYKRTQATSSREKKVTWPGIISASWVTRLSAHKDRMGHSERDFINYQMMARRALGAFRPKTDEATAILEKRALKKLYQDKTTT